MISLEGDARLSRGEGWILCSAVAELIAALAAISATRETVRQSMRPVRRIAASVAAIGAVSLLGAAAPGIDRVLLVAALLAICTIQTQLARA